MAIIHGEKMLAGKRLRRCSPLARLFWPWLYGVSNGLARIELDYELLADRFLTFRDMAPTPEKLEAFVREYEKNNLIFLYTFKDSIWGQWDITAQTDLKKLLREEEWDTPIPTEPAYTEWLRALHGEHWQEHHTEYSRQEMRKARSKAGRKGGLSSAQNRSKNEVTSSKLKQSQATSDSASICSSKSEQTEHGTGNGTGTGTGLGTGLGHGQGTGNGTGDGQQPGLEKPGGTTQPSAAVPNPGQNPVPGSGTVHTPASLAWLYDHVAKETGSKSTPANPEDFRQLPARQYGETALDIAWMWNKSKYWPEKIHSTADFVFQLERARGGIRTQRRNWCKTDGAKQEVARLLTKYEAALAEAGLAAYPHDQPGQRFDVEDLGE